MSLNFKNILFESIIDELETLSRMDKAVLKFLHQSMEKETFPHTIGKKTYEMDASDALIINDLINTFGLKDYDYVFKMWNFYKRFGNVLFDDEVFNDFSYTQEDYDDATKLIVAKYYIDNLVGREIYPGWTIEMMEDAIGMVEEGIMTFMVSNDKYETIFLYLLDLKGNRLKGDIITNNEDGLGAYFSKDIKVSKYADIIDTIEIPNPLKERLKDLSDKSLEKYFDFIIERLQDEIEEWDEDIRYYYKEIEPQDQN